MKRLYFILIFVYLGLSSCASKSKLEIVSNPKGAEVSISDRFVGDYKMIGKTPAVLDYKKNKIKGDFVYLSVKAKGYGQYNLVVPNKFSMGTIKVKLKASDQDDEAVEKEVQRKIASVRDQIQDDYKTQLESAKYNHTMQIQGLNDQLRMSQMLSMNQANIFQQEKKRLVEEMDEKNKKKTQTIFNKTFEIQNALQNKLLSKAGKALAELRQLDPPEGLFLTLEGNFEFLNGRVSKALASYKRALTVDPSNLELATIVKTLEKAVGG